jgi:hypothetical protein
VGGQPKTPIVTSIVYVKTGLLYSQADSLIDTRLFTNESNQQMKARFSTMSKEE